jgi:hypothetical protein
LGFLKIRNIFSKGAGQTSWAGARRANQLSKSADLAGSINSPFGASGIAGCAPDRKALRRSQSRCEQAARFNRAHNRAAIEAIRHSTDLRDNFRCRPRETDAKAGTTHGAV